MTRNQDLPTGLNEAEGIEQIVQYNLTQTITYFETTPEGSV